MPFAMIHLYIAERIINATNEISEPHQFLLGAIAPDAVHFIEGYEREMKFRSHFCVGHETWGNITNNKEWLANVICHIERSKNDRNRDFILGYYCHIITDIQNDLKVWKPFKEEIKDCTKRGIGKRYHEESNLMDHKLFIESGKSYSSRLYLAHGVDFGVLKKADIEKLKESFLFERYNNMPVEVDISKNQFVRLDEVRKFVEEESQYISGILFGV